MMAFYVLTNNSCILSKYLLTLSLVSQEVSSIFSGVLCSGGSVAEWLACWTQVQKGPGSNHSRNAVG